MSRPSTASRPILGGLVTAVRTLTILRVPGRDTTRPAASLVWFPLVGFILGGALLLLARGLHTLPVAIPPSGIAVVLLVASAL